jgi:mRNA-degrading endonuclease RelE of RelBE toxin-antitoxin system
MIVHFRKSFLNDIKKVKDKKLIQQIKDIALHIEKVKDLSEIKNVKKLVSWKYSYRMRIGNYRIGFYFINNEVELVRFVDRKEIYKFFPQKGKK